MDPQAPLLGRGPNTAAGTSAIAGGSILSYLPSYVVHHAVSRDLRPYISSPFSNNSYPVLKHGSFVLQSIEEISSQQHRENNLPAFEGIDHPFLGSNLPRSFHFYLLTNGIFLAYTSCKTNNTVIKNTNTMKKDDSMETDPTLLCFSLYGDQTVHSNNNEPNRLPICTPLHVQANQPFGFKVENILLLLPRNTAMNTTQKGIATYGSSNLSKHFVTITLSLDPEAGGTFMEGYQLMTSMTQCVEGTCQELWDEEGHFKQLLVSVGY